MKPKVKIVNARKFCKIQDILPPLETVNKEFVTNKTSENHEVNVCSPNTPDSESLEVIEETNVLLVGDLVWSRIPGHCWWPSMISYDPNTAVYFEKTSSKGLRFHVQFFGNDSMRGWVSKSNIIRYEGREHYMNLPSNMLGNKAKVPQSSRRESWNNAIIQADQALMLNRRERKLTFVFNYQSDSKKNSKKNSLAKLSKFNTRNSPKTSKGVDKKLHLGPTRRSSRSSSKTVISMQSNHLKPDSINSGETDVNKMITLGDIKQPLLEQNNNEPIMSHPSCNSSDSGIEDTIEETATEFPLDNAASKRSRKQKVFPDYHMGSELETAIEFKIINDKLIRGKSLKSIKEAANNVIALTQNPKGTIDLISKCETENIVLNIENLEPVDKNVSNLKLSTKQTNQQKLRITSNIIDKVELPPKEKRFLKRKAAFLPNKDKKPKIECKDNLDTSSQKDNTYFTVVQSDISDEKTDFKDIVTVKQKVDPEDFCALCEDSCGTLIFCNGVCANSFHLDCLGLAHSPKQDFICDECITGLHSCFICKQAGDVIKCAQISCGKFYHLNCVKKYPETKFEGKTPNKFFCAYHVCKYCFRQEKLHASNNVKKVKCIRCPTAYHQATCLIAGCGIISSQYMICDNHFEANSKLKNQGNVNVTWCFVCSTGGSLICCDTCPASFHPECIDNNQSLSDGSWQCKDCKDHKKLKYGDIVWIKFGVYKWWPGKICWPEEIPERIRRLPHALSQFPVMFFGSKDYAWLHSGRVFRYEEGDTGGSLPGSKCLAVHFQKALQEAAEHFAERKKEIALQEQVIDKRKSNKPQPYKVIKVNRPVTCIRTVLDPSEWPVCECRPTGGCSADSECLNRMLLFECSPKSCPAGESCQNQRMQKNQHVLCKPFKCDERGWGLKTEQDIKCGDFVIEYVGELIDSDTCRRRIQHYHGNNISDYYFLTIDKDNIIDAYPKGNLSRFMNHSCGPNCETQKWTVNGEVRVGLFATRSISAGEELCFNYNLDCLGNDKKKCKCGATNCSGFLGVPPKTKHSMDIVEKSKSKMKMDKKKKQKKKNEKTVHEDDCFICGDGGELILCGRGKCCKSYHVECLNIDKKPYGKWECPWHYCDGCGKLAKLMCTLCPNSFCDAHKEGEFVELVPGIFVCIDHSENEKNDLLQKMMDSKIDEKETTEDRKNEIELGDIKFIPSTAEALVSLKNDSTKWKKLKTKTQKNHRNQACLSKSVSEGNVLLIKKIKNKNQTKISAISNNKPIDKSPLDGECITKVTNTKITKISKKTSNAIKKNSNGKQLKHEDDSVKKTSSIVAKKITSKCRKTPK